MSEAMSAQGTYISFFDAGGSPELSVLSEVISIGGPNPDSEEIDVTHLLSPGRSREYLQSFLIPGEAPLVLNWIPTDATHDEVTGLRSLYESGEVRTYRITYPDATTQTFDAYVKSVTNPAAVGEALRMNVTLRVTGPVVTDSTPGSPA